MFISLENTDLLAFSKMLINLIKPKNNNILNHLLYTETIIKDEEDGYESYSFNFNNEEYLLSISNDTNHELNSDLNFEWDFVFLIENINNNDFNIHLKFSNEDSEYKYIKLMYNFEINNISYNFFIYYYLSNDSFEFDSLTGKILYNNYNNKIEFSFSSYGFKLLYGSNKLTNQDKQNYFSPIINLINELNLLDNDNLIPLIQLDLINKS